MDNEKIMKRSAIDFGKTSSIVQTIILALIALVTPAFIQQLLKNSPLASNAQYIVGSIVNTALIISAINLKGWLKIVPVITMPSVATVLSGLIFGPWSMPMVYMIPAIWVGNLLLVVAYKLFFLKFKFNYTLTGFIGIALKVAVIFGFFSILNKVGVIPEKAAVTLSTAMGITQIITATIGMFASSIIYEIENKRLNKA